MTAGDFHGEMDIHSWGLCVTDYVIGVEMAADGASLVEVAHGGGLANGLMLSMDWGA